MSFWDVSPGILSLSFAPLSPPSFASPTSTYVRTYDLLTLMPVIYPSVCLFQRGKKGKKKHVKARFKTSRGLLDFFQEESEEEEEEEKEKEEQEQEED